MSQFEYKPRVADAVLEKKINSSGAVLIEGPKWCGKTTTAEQHSKSVNYVSDPVNLNKNMILAEMNINVLLEGEKPRLLDEWQIIPQLWDAVRFAVDHSKGIGQFIMTGSAVPLDHDKQSKIHHTGTGRITSLRMRPMSLWESGDSSGEVSLATLFQNPGTPIYSEASAQLEDMAFLICRGGWPIAITLEPEYALETAFSYFKAVADTDISRVDGI